MTHTLTTSDPLQRTTLTRFEADRLEHLRVQFSGRAGLDELLTETRAEMLAEPVPPACPPWCGLTAGHTYDSVTDDDSMFVRFHEHSTGDLVSVCQEERYVKVDGRVELSASYVTTDADNIEMDHDRAVAHGAALLEAAAQLREIGGVA